MIDWCRCKYQKCHKANVIVSVESVQNAEQIGVVFAILFESTESLLRVFLCTSKKDRIKPK